MKKVRDDKSVILIGMPGVGKSTLGKQLALSRQYPFVDTDELLEKDNRQTLQSLLDAYGYQGLREKEEQSIVCRSFESMVVATGGSVVYSDAVMKHLQTFGVVIYLKASLTTLRSRINNFSTRGIACQPGQSFESVFAERLPLYERYADKTLSVDDVTEAEALMRLKNFLI